MPRVTRRSIAAKEESPPEESPCPTSRGRRSTAKKEEPKEEEVAIGEPQDEKPKRGGRQAKVKEPETKTPASKGRATSRSRGRGTAAKDVVENEEEEEKEEQNEVEKKAEKAEEEEEEEKPKGRGGRSRGRASTAAKAEASTSRGSSRSTRGRATKEEEPVPAEEKSIEEEKSVEESPTATKGRGTRSRGKAKVETTPSPRAGRSSRRGRGAEEKEEEMEAEAEETKKDEAKSEEKPVEEAKKLPTPSKEKAEANEDAPVPEAKAEDDESKAKTTAPEKSKEEVKSLEEPMDTLEGAADEPSPAKVSESPHEKKASSPTKKRKLEEDDEKPAAKIPKRDEAEPAEMKDLSDYVVVNKDDVPAADSKEVLDCVPKVQEPPSDPPAMETEASDSTFVPPPKDGEPVIVPLTEAELAKQYTQIQVDRDEASSTLVEVGSEGATDTTAMSIRSLDVSDAVSMDSISTVDDNASNPSGQRAITPGSGSNSAEGQASAIPTATIPVPQQEMKSSPVKEDVKSLPEHQAAKSSPVKEDVKSLSTHQEVKSSPAKDTESSSAQQEAKSASDPVSSNSASTGPAPSRVHQNNVQHEHQQVNSVAAPAQSQQPAAPAAVEEVASPPAQPSPVAASTPAPVADSTAGRIERNGTVEAEPTPQKKITQNSTPDAISKSPVKQPSSVTPADYVPSSPAIDKRKFIPNPAFPLDLMDPAFCFSVVSYNILAECHWKRSDYSYTPVEYMELGYRHTLLLKELDYLEGDIVCLQEVEPKYYKDTLLPAMTARGYSGWFIRRTQDYYDEGEATFVKNSRFNVKSSEGISLKELAYKEIDESGLSAEVSSAVKKYLDRADVLMLSQLECLKTGKTLTLGNIHVVYSPPAPDVQCIEIACAIKQLVSKAGNDLNPHIICGDFNSKVTMAGYQLAKDGYLSDDHIRSLQAIEALTNTDGSSRSLIHHLWKAFQHTSSNLKSAYEVSMSKEPPVTSYTCNQHGCLDYVFFSSASLDTVGVLETVDQVEVEKNGGLPSINIPSDHLSLKAVFRMK